MRALSVILIPLSGCHGSDDFLTDCSWRTPVAIARPFTKVRVINDVESRPRYFIGSYASPYVGQSLELFTITCDRAPNPHYREAPRSINGVVDSEMKLHLFWTSRCCPGAAGDTVDALYASVLAHGAWSEPSMILAARRIGREGIGVPIVDFRGKVHVPASVADRGVQRLIHVAGNAESWTVVRITPMGAYPRFAVLEDSALGALYVAAQRNPARRDQNSVWFSRWTKSGWSLPILVDESGDRPAFDPMLVESDRQLHVFWTKDMNGSSLSREALLWTTSTDRGLTFAQAAVIATGAYISHVQILKISGGGLLLFFLEARGLGSGGALFVSEHGNGWTRPRKLYNRADIADYAVTATKDGVELVFSSIAREQADSQQVLGVFYTRGHCLPPRVSTEGSIEGNGYGELKSRATR